NQLKDHPADQLLRPIAEKLLGSRVLKHDPPAGVEHRDDVERAIDQLAKEPLAGNAEALANSGADERSGFQHCTRLPASIEKSLIESLAHGCVKKRQHRTLRRTSRQAFLRERMWFTVHSNSKIG